MSKYYRNANGSEDSTKEYNAFAFTMRMLNFLFRLGVKAHWNYLDVDDIRSYAMRPH